MGTGVNFKDRNYLSVALGFLCLLNFKVDPLSCSIASQKTPSNLAGGGGGEYSTGALVNIMHYGSAFLSL